ncbi:MAG: Undecaprenyl-phosphate 4-deoxy-4-formamido-L-arabinose transferase [Bacteroidetes bacterium ADurb.Bin234]|jgi:glycosyltransferase involved in cell wall biosynthesis|nr:MAG: Undecaprenyl-phosphate 4-deoxy-4-formamido-L-arabinose transferase [Bacteroidetes bacterium ADurb.Bin234]
MDISIVIPLLNEEESLPELTDWINKVMNEKGFSYEIIFVDDGSTDHSWSIIEQLGAENPSVKGIRFQRNYGKSAALNVGFEVTQGDVVITMDADLQDSPDEIPELYEMITAKQYDLVSGWKKVRYDAKFAKNIPSKFFNWTTRKISKIKLHDFNCGLKAYRSDVVKTIEVYGEMHRYIPVIAKWAGFTKIGEKVVKHQKRKYGTTKFGWNRFINGYLDLISIMFVSRFGKKPMHFFGLGGTLSFLIGFVITLWLIIQKLINIAHGVAYYRQVTDQPLFYLALLVMVFGMQLFLAGFLGEMVSRNSSERNKYIIRTKYHV